MASASTSSQLRSLTGLRALAAATVLGSHLRELTGGHLHAVLTLTVSQGSLGVSMFFVLSGFVLTWSERPGQTAGSFYRRRLARIYPAYVVALAAGVLITHFFEHDHVAHRPFAMDVLLLQSWVPTPTYFFSVNAVSWSLSCEAFFYLLFPVILPWLKRLSTKDQIRVGSLVFSCFVAVQIVCTVLEHGPGVATGQGGPVWFAYIFPPTRFCEFVLGMLLALYVKSGGGFRLGFRPWFALLAATYFVAASRGNTIGWDALTLVPVLGVLGSAAVSDIDQLGAGTLWADRRVVWLGTVSYCFYLTHQLIVRVVFAHFRYSTRSGLSGLGWLLALMFAAVIAAALLHYAVERPGEHALSGDRTVSVADDPTGGQISSYWDLRDG